MLAKLLRLRLTFGAAFFIFTGGRSAGGCSRVFPNLQAKASVPSAIPSKFKTHLHSHVFYLPLHHQNLPAVPWWEHGLRRYLCPLHCTVSFPTRLELNNQSMAVLLGLGGDFDGELNEKVPSWVWTTFRVDQCFFLHCCGRKWKRRRKISFLWYDLRTSIPVRIELEALKACNP